MIAKYIKPSEYAKIMDMHVLTVRKHFHDGKIEGIQDPDTGMIKLLNPLYQGQEVSGNKVILYARVSSSSNKKSLDGQIEKLESYAYAKGYTIIDEVKEVGSGLNDHRPQFIRLLKRTDYNILLAEHKESVTRFDYNYLKVLLDRCGIKLEVVNKAEVKSKDQELVDDFYALVTSFCNRIYGRRRKDKAKKIIEDLKDESKTKEK